MTATTRSPASGSTNEAKSGRSGTGAWDCVNTDRSIAGATSRGRATAHATAATAEAAIDGDHLKRRQPDALPFREPHRGQPRHCQLPVRRAERQLKQHHGQRQRGGEHDGQGEEKKRALLQRRPGQLLQCGGPGGDGRERRRRAGLPAPRRGAWSCRWTAR